jgi:hypothetical protein
MPFAVVRELCGETPQRTRETRVLPFAGSRRAGAPEKWWRAAALQKLPPSSRGAGLRRDKGARAKTGKWLYCSLYRANSAYFRLILWGGGSDLGFAIADLRFGGNVGRAICDPGAARTGLGVTRSLGRPARGMPLCAALCRFRLRSEATARRVGGHARENEDRTI